jgi:hypothetical protein
MITDTKEQRLAVLFRKLSLEFDDMGRLDDEWLHSASVYAYCARERAGHEFEGQIRNLIRKHVEPLVEALQKFEGTNTLTPAAPTPVTVAPKADYTLDDVKAIINNLLAANADNKDAIKATIGAYAPALAQCSQMQLNAIADELEKLQ